MLNNDASLDKKRTMSAGSSYLSYANLQDLLAQGWKIEQPVYARPLWRMEESERITSSSGVGERVNLVSLPDSPALRQFSAECQLTLDHLREEIAGSTREQY